MRVSLTTLRKIISICNLIQFMLFSSDDHLKKKYFARICIYHLNFFLLFDITLLIKIPKRKLLYSSVPTLTYFVSLYYKFNIFFIFQGMRRYFVRIWWTTTAGKRIPYVVLIWKKNLINLYISVTCILLMVCISINSYLCYDTCACLKHIL